MKRTLILIFLTTLLRVSFAQPMWEVATYTNSTIAYGVVTINGLPAHEGDLVGAFVENECRAISEVIINKGIAYANLTINGEVVETVTFKVCERSTGIIYEAASSIQTAPGSTLGAGGNFLTIAAASSETHNISLSASPNEGGSVSGGGNYALGKTITISARPNAGYGFINWTEHGRQVSSLKNYTFPVVKGRELVANFSKETFTVSIQVGIEGAEVNLHGFGSLITGAEGKATFSNILSGSYNYWVNADGYAPKNGSITVAGNDVLETLVLTANSNETPHWDVKTYTNSTVAYGVVTIDDLPADTSDIVAAFVGEECRAFGKVIVNEGIAYSNLTIHGETVETITFKVWDRSKNAIRDVVFTTLSAPGSTIGGGGKYLPIAATSTNTFELNLSAEPKTGGSVKGGGSFVEGSEITVKATPAKGYKFVSWTEGNNVVSTDTNYVFSIDSNKQLVANFSSNDVTYGVTLFSSPVEGGVVKGGGIYIEGTEVTALAKANPGYEFINWTENGNIVSTDTNYVFVVRSNKIVGANFRMKKVRTIATICDGDSYLFGSQLLTKAGQYSRIFKSSTGCDSTVVLTLNVNPSYNRTMKVSILEGDKFSFGTQTLTKSGQYTEVFKSVTGCDSTITVTLNVVRPIDAQFKSDKSHGDAPLTVHFSDGSSNNPTSWKWNFGDKSASVAKDPVHTFDKPGTYTIKLIAANEFSEDSLIETSYITVNEPYIPKPPHAKFVCDTTWGDAPLSVHFSDLSSNTPTTWEWNFGDGKTATEQNPTHTYSNAGVYSVELIAVNSDGRDTLSISKYIVVNEPEQPTPPITRFSSNVVGGDVPLVVQFKDESVNNPTSWLWNFGDNETSTDKNPTHIYQNPGIYSVKLLVSNNDGTDSLTMDSIIIASEPITYHDVKLSFVDNDKPLSSVLVHINNIGTKFTDANGEVIFEDIRRDTSMIFFASKPGYESVQNYINIEKSDIETKVSLQPIVVETHRVTFKVEGTNEPVEGASILLGNYDAILTDANGEVSFNNVVPGEFNYSISAKNYNLKIGSIGVSNDDVIVELPLESSLSSLTFNVTSNGEPIEGATVLLSGYESENTNSMGNIVYEGIHSNRLLEYCVYSPNYKFFFSEVIVTNDNKTIEVELTPISETMSLKSALIHTNTYTSTLHVTNDGEPISGAMVIFEGVGLKTTNNNGDASIQTSTLNETIRYTVSVPGYDLIIGSFAVDSENTLVNIELQPATSEVKFILTDNDVAVSNASVTLGSYGTKVSDQDGVVIFTDVYITDSLCYSISSAEYLVQVGSVEVNSDEVVELNMIRSGGYSVQFNIASGSTSVSNASILIDGHKVLFTNEYGLAKMSGIAHGQTLSYNVIADGYDIYAGKFSIDSDDVTVDVDLSNSVYNAIFTVTNGDFPIAGANVTLGEYGSKNTDENGIVFFSGIHNKSVECKINASGYEAYSKQLKISSNVSYSLSLSPNRFNVSLTISDKNGVLKGAKVTVDGFGDIISDENGIVLLKDVTPSENKVSYTVKANSYNEVKGTFQVIDQDVFVNVKLEQTTYQVEFVVTDGTNPLANITINLGSFGTITTDENGKAIINSLLPNSILDVSISSVGFKAYNDKITVDEPHSVKQITLMLTSIQEFSTKDIKMYPNPAKNEVFVNNCFGQTIRIYDMCGRVVYQLKSSAPNLKINIEGLHSGIYTVKLGDLGTKILIVE